MGSAPRRQDAIAYLGVELGAELGPARRHWGGSGPEWDVVAESADRRTLLVGEAKWSSAHAADESLARAYASLVAKGSGAFGERRAVVQALFVPRLPRRRPKSIPAGVRLVDARMVIAAVSRRGG